MDERTSQGRHTRKSQDLEGWTWPKVYLDDITVVTLSPNFQKNEGDDGSGTVSLVRFSLERHGCHGRWQAGRPPLPPPLGNRKAY